MNFFSMHQSMAKKVQETDKIFRIFVFCMLASGVPMMVFGTITLIRRETLVSFLMALYDLIFCVLQLTAFTVAPAQLYAEVRDFYFVFAHPIECPETSENSQIYSMEDE
ncbi:hypothetical protein Ddc_17964 [Ditylenchus destructor]|nr:hypothetical protein Ddc_17964 [Ditylenchus destructor]